MKTWLVACSKGGVGKTTIATHLAAEAAVAGLHVALVDAGAIDDPVVGGVDGLLEIVVGDHLQRQRAAPAGDDGATNVGRDCWHGYTVLNQAMGWRRVTRSPAIAM